MRLIPVLAASLVAATTALADGRAITGPEFEALTDGKTLTFSQNGRTYGAEQYLPDRQVIWRYLGGQCETGRWYAEGERLCFVYENGPGPLCWIFEAREGTYFARRDDLPSGDASELKLETITEVPLVCAGPDLGV